MFIENQIPSRQQDEKLILFLRRHWAILLGRWIIFLSMGLIPVGFYFYLTYSYPWILTNAFWYPLLLLLASSYYLFIILFLFNSFIDFYLDVWIVTDQRIINIEQRGLFNREIAEHSLDRIQDISGFQKGFWQTFFNFGNIHVQTAGEVQHFIFRQVGKPFEIVRVLNNLVQKHEQEFDNRVMETIKEKQEGAE